MREEGGAQSCLKSQANINSKEPHNPDPSRAAGELPAHPNPIFETRPGRAVSHRRPDTKLQRTALQDPSPPPLSAEGPDHLQPLREHIGKCSTRR
ncbi:hypothetical protein PGT21_021687 [Puccinia graminis f. sp. tritici]|uniref:Uncharacterized protein n=1 Tax=Puccinia graminis f. sp. tritici TaxID=56615 RepID=A0A5B0N323_PUCGR|nr:hypothetical protein PGT21_021687 [Puccinia graminis f. sp. tritici]